MPSLQGKKIMVGYWHNWDQGVSYDYEGGYPTAAKLAETPEAFNVVVVSFMKVNPGDDFPTFRPYYGDDKSFRAEIAKLNGQGRAVLISLGGADAHIEFHKGDETKLSNEIIRLVDTYGFDGLDIDLEQGAIEKADNRTVIPEALKMVRSHYQAQGKHFIISMAPEFPNLLNTSPLYAPYINSLEGVYDFIAPQLYNQAGAGIGFQPDNPEQDGYWVSYAQNDDSKKYEFLYYLSKDLITGKYKNFAVQIPSDKLVLGLPSSHSAAGNGMVKDPQVVYRVFESLAKENLPLKGVMTWSVNWDEGTNMQKVPFDGQFRKAYTKLISDGSVTPEEDRTPPSVPGNLEAQPFVTSVKLSWSASTDNRPGEIRYQVLRNGKEVGKVTALTFTDNNLQPDTDYQYAVSAIDVANNVSQAAAAQVKTEKQPTEDTQAPSTPTGLVVKSNTAQGITLAWQPSTDNVGVKGYEIYRDGLYKATSANPQWTDTAIEAGVSYRYSVRAFDEAQNVSEISQEIEVESVQIDPAGPEVPTGLNASSVDKTSLTLSWGEVDKAVRYHVTRNGSTLGPVKGSQFADSNLTPATTYSYTVMAEDAAGRTSAASAALTVTTLASEVVPGTKWQSGTDYVQGNEVTYEGKKYRCLQGHHAYAHWTPDGTASLWEVVK
jgi:Chitinase